VAGGYAGAPAACLLSVPEETKQFVPPLREPGGSPQDRHRDGAAVFYILAAQNLSEQSASDAERLIREVRPSPWSPRSRARPSKLRCTNTRYRYGDTVIRHFPHFPKTRIRRYGKYIKIYQKIRIHSRRTILSTWRSKPIPEYAIHKSISTLVPFTCEEEDVGCPSNLSANDFNSGVL
jgi:hypothetical protein